MKLLSAIVVVVVGVISMRFWGKQKCLWIVDVRSSFYVRCVMIKRAICSSKHRQLSHTYALLDDSQLNSIDFRLKLSRFFPPFLPFVVTHRTFCTLPNASRTFIQLEVCRQGSRAQLEEMWKTRETRKNQSQESHPEGQHGCGTDPCRKCHTPENPVGELFADERTRWCRCQSRTIRTNHTECKWTDDSWAGVRVDKRSRICFYYRCCCCFV